MCSHPTDPSDDGTSLADLERQICEGAADLAAATFRWLLLVAEFDEREGWAEWGVNSCAHWLSWRVGIGLSAAREQVRVARALAGLPVVCEHFRTGELSYSKVRAITRVAQPETEEQLVEIARYATGAVLDKVVSGYAGVIRVSREQAQAEAEKQRLACHWEPDGMLHIEGRLRAEDGAALLSALDAVPLEDPEVHSPLVNRAQALVELATPDRSMPSPELVVHVDATSLSQERIDDQCHLHRGPAIAPETARRLGCDAGIRTIIEQDGQVLAVGRRTRTIGPALKRALESRDAGCRFPGCTNDRFLHAHHIRHWAQGGRTDLANLVQLCPTHHRLVHEGGYRMDVGDDGSPRFYNRGGWLIPRAGDFARSQGLSIREQNKQVGLHIDANTSRPLTPGDRCDYGIAIEGLAQMWLPDQL